MTPTHLKPGPSHRDVDEDLPVTSYPCQWKEPRKRKQSNLKLSDAKLEKHMYGKPKKVSLSPLEEFDPRPSKYRGTASSHLTDFLGKVRGKGLGVSLLFDSSTQHWTVDEPSSDNQLPNLPSNLPSHHNLLNAIEEFKKSLHVSEEEARKIERETTKQRFSTLWYTVR